MRDVLTSKPIQRIGIIDIGARRVFGIHIQENRNIFLTYQRWERIILLRKESERTVGSYNVYSAKQRRPVTAV